MTAALNRTRKRKIDQAIEDGAVPYSKKSKVLLKTGPKSFITLATAQGSTQNGKYWTETDRICHQQRRIWHNCMSNMDRANTFWTLEAKRCYSEPRDQKQRITNIRAWAASTLR